MTSSGSGARTDSWTRTTLLALLLVVLGQLLLSSDGHYTPEAIRWLAFAAVLGAVALAVPPHRLLERLGPCLPAGILLAGLVLQLGQVLTRPPGMYLRPTAGWSGFLFPVAAAAVVAGSLAFAGPRWARLGTALVALFFLAAGVWVLHASPRPVIDVFVFQQQSSAALLRGQNPYAITFPNIYGHSPFYGPELTDGRTLFFGFPYPPFSLVLAALGYLTAGDHRTAQLVAFAAGAACLLALRPDRLGALTAATFLLTPRGLFVLEQGWTEPFGVALLGLVLLAALHARRWLWLALGALLAWKQYAVVLLPLTALLVPRPFSWRALARLVLPALAVAVAAALPFLAWNAGAFWRSVVWLQTVQPFRADALSFPSALAALGVAPPPIVPTLLVLTALATGLVLWRAPRTPQGFATGAMVVLGVFFAFNKQSFCNYWFLVLGAAALAIPAIRLDSTGEQC